MEIVKYPVLPSTSAVAAEAAKNGAKHLYTVVAERQTAGRGRLERRFFSPEGGLYFSTVLRTGLSPAEYGAVTPFAAVAVFRAISRVCGVVPEIKWVNDLLLHGRKICGILAESGTDKKGAPYLILGIGVNTGTADFPAELRDIAARVPCRDRDALLAAVLAELADTEHAVKSGSWLADYRRHSCVLARDVEIVEGNARRRARALDILPSGALSVRLENGRTEELYGAEISLRVTQDPKN